MTQQQTVTLQLTVNQVNTVLAGIAKLPIEFGLDTFNVIQQQAQQQLGQPGQMPPEGELSDKVIQ